MWKACGHVRYCVLVARGVGASASTDATGVTSDLSALNSTWYRPLQTTQPTGEYSELVESDCNMICFRTLHSVRSKPISSMGRCSYSTISRDGNNKQREAIVLPSILEHYAILRILSGTTWASLAVGYLLYRPSNWRSLLLDWPGIQKAPNPISRDSTMMIGQKLSWRTGSWVLSSARAHVEPTTWNCQEGVGSHQSINLILASAPPLCGPRTGIELYYVELDQSSL